jgi:hypothetical protein
MKNLLPISPEVSTDLSNLHIRVDLINRSVSVYLKDWTLWHVDTSQVQVSDSLIHFTQPDGEIVGIKCFSAGEDQR